MKDDGDRYGYVIRESIRTGGKLNILKTVHHKNCHYHARNIFLNELDDRRWIPSAEQGKRKQPRGKNNNCANKCAQ